MIEHELSALADRLAPPEPADLPGRVLGRIDELDTEVGGSPTRVRGLVVAGVAALVGVSFVLPQVRAVAADLLGAAGIELSTDSPEAPDAPPEPLAPLPDSRGTSLAEAEAQVAFPILVPSALGPPDEVTVADGGRVVTLSWTDDGVLLDQFDGSLGPVFSKEVLATEPRATHVGGEDAWWVGSAHDLTYIDREGTEITESARRAGPSLVWDARDVTFRLEGELGLPEALAIARTLR